MTRGPFGTSPSGAWAESVLPINSRPGGLPAASAASPPGCMTTACRAKAAAVTGSAGWADRAGVVDGFAAGARGGSTSTSTSRPSSARGGARSTTGVAATRAAGFGFATVGATGSAGAGTGDVVAAVRSFEGGGCDGVWPSVRPEATSPGIVVPDVVGAAVGRGVGAATGVPPGVSALGAGVVAPLASPVTDTLLCHGTGCRSRRDRCGVKRRGDGRCGGDERSGLAVRLWRRQPIRRHVRVGGRRAVAIRARRRRLGVRRRCAVLRGSCFAIFDKAGEGLRCVAGPLGRFGSRPAGVPAAGSVRRGGRLRA